MKFKYFVLSLLLLSASKITHSQSYILIDTNYIDQIAEAGILCGEGEYSKAISTYEKCMKIRGLTRSSYYYLAVNYSKLDELDSAFKYFEKAIDLGLNFDYIKNDTNLVRLKSAPQWGNYVNKFSKAKEGKVQFPELSTQLKQRGTMDQKQRKIFVSDFTKPINWDEQGQIDDNNQIWLDSIIDIYGWPTEKKVGFEASNAAGLIAQHADYDIEFQMKVLKLMWETDECSLSKIAYLQDRILVNAGKKQIFGTQFISTNTENGITLKPKPILNPAMVDLRRWAVDQMPLSEYLSRTEQYYNKKK